MDAERLLLIEGDIMTETDTNLIPYSEIKKRFKELGIKKNIDQTMCTHIRTLVKKGYNTKNFFCPVCRFEENIPDENGKIQCENCGKCYTDKSPGAERFVKIEPEAIKRYKILKKVEIRNNKNNKKEDEINFDNNKIVNQNNRFNELYTKVFQVCTRYFQNEINIRMKKNPPNYSIHIDIIYK